MEEDIPWYDSSKISAFQLCPQRYSYRYEQHLVPLGGEEGHDTSLAFGLAIHKALETFYDNTAFERLACVCGVAGRTDEQVLECPYHLTDGTTPKIIHTFLTHYLKDPADEKDPRTRWNGAMLLKAYLEKWKRESFTVEAIEVPFEIPFYVDCYNCHVLNVMLLVTKQCPECKGAGKVVIFKYTGRIDLLIRDVDGRLKPWDHKTARWFGDYWMEQFSVSHQQTGYMYATEMITKESVTTGWINGLKTPTKTKLPDEDSFLRLETARTPAEFDLWIQHMLHYHKQIQEMKQQNFFPRSSPFACHAYNRRCPYYGLCTSQGDVHDNILNNSFEKQPWNPRDAD